VSVFFLRDVILRRLPFAAKVAVAPAARRRREPDNSVWTESSSFDDLIKSGPY